MALIRVKSTTGEVLDVGEEWLERWPDDFQAVDPATPLTGTPAPAAAPVQAAPTVDAPADEPRRRSSF